MTAAGQATRQSLRCAAVVVTFNRLALLKKTLDGIRAQTRTPDAIIVVNNGSTDGTDRWLNEQSGIEVVHQDNVGGAGGFETGMKRAFEMGAEWIWVMDDDVFPRPDVLEKLLGAGGISKCVLPTRVFSDGNPCRWGHVFDLRKRSIVFGTRPAEQDASKEFVCVNTCCFEGMLVHRSIVERIGFPDARFFLSWDDTVYGLMASRYTNVLVVRDAVMERAKDSAANAAVSPLFAYYHFRNFHLVGEYYRRLSGGDSYGLTAHLKYLVGSFLFLKNCWLNSRETFPAVVTAVRRGIVDSYRKKIGNTH